MAISDGISAILAQYRSAVEEKPFNSNTSGFRLLKAPGSELQTTDLLGREHLL